METKINCIHGYKECENYPYCASTEGCLEEIDYIESKSKSRDCPLAGGVECCADCRECQKW